MASHTLDDPPARRGFPASGFAEADGLQVAFRTFGVGPPLVLAHGWGADVATNWIDTGWIAELESRRTLFGIDLRGHGRSDKPHAREPYGYGAMATDVLAVMNRLDIDRCDFMGYSMGAFIGAYLLGHHPERFNAMVLGGIGDETEASAAQGEVIARALREPDPRRANDRTSTGVRRFVGAIPGNDLEALACSAQQMWPEGHPLELAGPGLSKACLPVLIVNGEEDHPYVDSADTFANALPNARHLKIPGADHLTAVPSKVFKQAVVAFLDGNDR